MSDEYPTIKKHNSGLKDANTRVKDLRVFLDRTWPIDMNPTIQVEPEQANIAGSRSMIQRWADEDMTEQPYNTIGLFRPLNNKRSNAEGNGNNPLNNNRSNAEGNGSKTDTKQEDARSVASTKAVCGSDR
ncbi:hypothetical protein N7G274_004114 [Stereocaulon virgatum]|uniref:Uncharacterized protein n=1 Tax=Stereocaulon virgatum TaxID=373712 RepID=A0ABR4ABA6_9LECA